MRFDVVTLFPDLFTPHLTLGVTRRAFATKQLVGSPGTELEFAL